VDFTKAATMDGETAAYFQREKMPAPRRRLPVLWVLAAIAMLVIVVLLCVMLRPLDDVEKSLVGEWEFATVSAPIVMRQITLNADRTFEFWISQSEPRFASRKSGSGTWKVSNGSLVFEVETVDMPTKLSKVAPYWAPKQIEKFTILELTPDHARLRSAQNDVLDLERTGDE
jgi:hypothetical protein